MHPEVTLRLIGNAFKFAMRQLVIKSKTQIDVKHAFLKNNNLLILFLKVTFGLVVDSYI